MTSMQRTFYIYCLFLAPFWASAQNLSGSWYGRADVEMKGMHNNYLTELVVKQKGNRVEGVFGYYFRDKYQSIFIHGTFNPKTREVIILNIPVIYYGSNSTVNSIDCNMNFRGVIINSKLGSSLKGYFYHDARYKFMCPDLKVSYELDRSEEPVDSVFKVATSSRMWKPQSDDYIVDVAAAAKKPDSAQLAIKSEVTTVVLDSPKTAAPDTARAEAIAKLPDTVKTVSVDSPRAAVAAMAIAEPDDNKKISESFVKRKAVLNKELDIESDSIRVSFYDNGEIDGDSISVFVNNKVVLTHQLLAAKAFNIYLHLDSTLEVNEISMFAENLGKYPPNTALMVVTDGKNRYEVFMSSSLTENSTIRLRRKR
jgi:hypothetical protein